MTTLATDVVIIGSGAGGAPLAKELAEGGARVVVLEEGTWHEPASFTARPRDMTTLLYRDAGQIATIGTPPIILPLGRAVGGTTVINSGTCFRTPAKVLERWRTDFGLDGLTEAALEPYFTRVEAEIGVARVPAALAGANARKVRDGAERLGLHGDFLLRNARGCVGSGVCAFGCPSGAKQHMGATYMPAAVNAGAVVVTQATARRIEHHRGRARAVIATTPQGELRVEADTVVVAAGAIHTPGLLRRNRLGTHTTHLGGNLSIHPATALRAVYDDPIDMWDGVPQSYYVDALADEGIIFEGIAGPPDQGALATPRTGAEHRDLMLDIRRTGTFGVMVSDASRGRVHDRFGRTVIRYDLLQEDAARFQRGFEVLADIFFAAGARKVLVPAAGVPTLYDGDTAPLHARRLRPRDLSLMAFHPLGTARAGADPAAAVVDGDLRVHGTANVFVSDGSVVPSSLGVNPQVTIMALASRLADHLLGRRTPSVACAGR